MNFEKLVPNIFYVDIADGVRMFVDCLGFEIGHDERTFRQPFCVVERDGLRINLFENAELASEHNPVQVGHEKYRRGLQKGFHFPSRIPPPKPPKDHAPPMGRQRIRIKGWAGWCCGSGVVK